MRLPFHYGWIIVMTGMVTIVACLGFARFALGMLLPAMGEALELSYTQMGFISTGNFVGYLAAVIISGKLYTRLGARKLIVSGLTLCALTMLVVSRAGGFWQVFVAYILTGLGSGASNVPMMALVSHWFRKSHRGRAAGLIVIGSGFIGTATLPFVAPSRPFQLSLGIEESLKVRRAVATRSPDRQDPRRFGFDIEVANFGREEQTVTVVDNYPVADIEEVEVELDPSTTKPSAHNRQDGILFWDLTVPAGGVKAVHLEYTIEYP